MTTFAAGSSAMLLPSRYPVHPALRSAARETAQLCALVAGYAVLLALFAAAALSLWLDLPTAFATSRLIPETSQTAPDAPVKLRGSL